MSAVLNDASVALEVRQPTSMQQHGFVAVRGLFGDAQVASMRDALSDAFTAATECANAPPECGRILSDLFLWPRVYPLLFTGALFSSLRSMFGEGLVMLPEHSAHREGFGGWHKDTDMFERAGLFEHWSDDFEIYQGAVYLQDNSVEHGGGLSVVPGNHRVRRPPVTLADKAARDQWYAEQRPAVLDTRAGDLVLFHTRLDHRATPRSAEVAPYGDKLAVFFILGRDNRHAKDYSRFIHRRPDYGYLKQYRIPAEMQRLAASHGLRFAD